MKKLQCSLCGQIKSQACFPRYAKPIWKIGQRRIQHKRANRYSTCSQCYKATPEGFAIFSKIQERNRTHKQRLLKWVNDYKRLHGCKHCGYNKCLSALEFHHIKNKKFSISSAIRDLLPKTRIIYEIRQCILLCANCHREEHYNFHNQLDSIFADYIDY